MPLQGPVDVSDLVPGFARDGHACVPGLATSGEVAALRPHVAAAARTRNPEPPPLESRDTYGKAFLQSMNVWRLDEAVRSFVWSPRFAAVAAALLEVDGVRLYHDQALFKEPGGGPTPWHQDQVYWPLDTDRTITMWMPLGRRPQRGRVDDVRVGSHRQDVSAFDISDGSDGACRRWSPSVASSCTPTGALRAGDATFHAGWTLHRAGPNPTADVREVMTVIWYADGARATAPANPYQEADLRLWLKGTEPGELATGPHNPLLWPAAAA
jgi:ectoine hydroxylase-related dioxygenase (phytanoyl-CoA dioxygenase family)